MSQIPKTLQSISLRLITSSPWYITNNNLYKDLKIPILNQLAKFCSKLNSRSNPLIEQLFYISLNGNLHRRLKSQKTVA